MKISIYELIKNSYYYLFSKLFLCTNLDKRILKSKYFSGKLNGIFKVGWKWMYFTYKGNKSVGKNTKILFPYSPLQTIINPHNIKFHIDDINNFQSPGCYFQAINEITLGKGTYIGPNVGIITANHDPLNLSRHLDSYPVKIGNNCWIGMNSVILPGVILGDNTIVGAGSIVTKNFSGNCIIAGSPAKKLKDVVDQHD